MADVIVIGGGHNGLAAAITLAKAGRDVVLLEARGELGGVAAGREFHPGYRHTGILHHTHLQPATAAALGLATTPVPAPRAAGLDEAGAVVQLGDDPSWDRWNGFRKEIGDFSRGVLSSPAPAFGTEAPLWPLAKNALGLRRLGRATMLELLRLGPQCLDDFTSEWIDDPQRRAMWMLPALVGTWAGPRSPVHVAALLVHEITRGEVRGGPAAVVQALEYQAKANGVELRTGARVSRIRVDPTGVRGVTLESGEAVDATSVLSAIGPRRTLLDLVPAPWLDAVVERDIEDVRTRGIVAKVHLALSAPLTLDGALHEACAVVAHPHEIERAFDGAKYGALSEHPLPLDLRQPSIVDASLAPDGHGVASLLVHGVPYDLAGGWTPDARTDLLDRVLRSMERWWPDIRDRVVAHELLTPVDLESEYGLEGGHLFHGDRALDQMWSMRPTSQLAQYAVPGLEGLYLGSSGCHPGGGVSCLPGLLSARTLLGA